MILQLAALAALAIGHEYRQDDSPSIAAAPDGSLWAAWLSFDGARDDVAIRRYAQGQWHNLQWVPGTSGDSWLPQVKCKPNPTGGTWGSIRRQNVMNCDEFGCMAQS